MSAKIARGCTQSNHDIEDGRLSDGEITTDERTITSLTLEDSDKSVATRPLTGGNGVVIRSYTTSPHYLPLAVLTVFVNPLFGLAAVCCACLSRSHRLHGDDRRATDCGKASFWVSIIGLAVGIVAAVFVIVYVYVIIPNIIRVDIWSDLAGLDHHELSQLTAEDGMGLMGGDKQQIVTAEISRVAAD